MKIEERTVHKVAVELAAVGRASCIQVPVFFPCEIGFNSDSQLSLPPTQYDLRNYSS